MTAASSPEHALNAICPYFTMFPLSFPLSVLTDRADPGDWVLDPFCGRGTTNFAARLLELPTVGIDSSPVGAAIAEAKLVSVTPNAIVREARMILTDTTKPVDVPQGEFWRWAYHPDVLRQLCGLRESLSRDCKSPSRKALRAILLGALHGPRTKAAPSHMSNQCPRTYAPKPRYATEYWRTRSLLPEHVDVFQVIERRAKRYFAPFLPRIDGTIRCGDSRERATFTRLGRRFRWVITSPPYYGMRTYIPDQWLRGWFLGGTAEVDYSQSGQLTHRGNGEFVAGLTTVWERVREVCLPDATLVVRFGAINDRAVDPVELLGSSLDRAGWTIAKTTPAGTAIDGKRQSDHFVRNSTSAIAEFDVWAKLR